MSFLSTLDNLRPTPKGDKGAALEYVVLCHDYLLSPEDNLKKCNWYPNWWSEVEPNTQAVVIPVQWVRRPWPPGSGYTAVVSNTSPSTGVLFIAMLHHRFQWSFKAMGIPYGVHKNQGDRKYPLPSLSTGCFWKLCIQALVFIPVKSYNCFIVAIYMIPELNTLYLKTH